MLEVGSLDDVGSALDIAIARDLPLAMSLGRHTNDLMTSFYVRTPSGFEIEYGTGGRLIDDATWIGRRVRRAEPVGPPAAARRGAATAVDRPPRAGDVDVVRPAASSLARRRRAPRRPSSPRRTPPGRRAAPAAGRRVEAAPGGRLPACAAAGRRWGGGEVELVEFLDAVTSCRRPARRSAGSPGSIGVHPWQLALFDDEAQAATCGATTRRRCTRRRTTRPGTRRRRRRRLPRVGPLVVLVRLRPLPRRQPRRRRRRPRRRGDRRLPVVPPARRRVPHRRHLARRRPARHGQQGHRRRRRRSCPAHRTQSHTDYAMGDRAAGPGSATTVRCTGCRGRSCSTWPSPRPCSAPPRASSTSWIVEARDRVVPGASALADDPLTQRRVAEAAWTLDAAMTLLRTDAAELTRRAERRRRADDGRSGHVPLAPQPQLRAGRQRRGRPDACRVRPLGVPRPPAAAALPGHPGRARPRLPAPRRRWPRPSAARCSARRCPSSSCRRRQVVGRAFR